MNRNFIQMKIIVLKGVVLILLICEENIFYVNVI